MTGSEVRGLQARRQRRPNDGSQGRPHHHRGLRSADHDKIYIDGAWVSSQGTGSIDVFDSTNGEVIGRI
jgi:hypothetical protein